MAYATSSGRLPLLVVSLLLFCSFSLLLFRVDGFTRQRWRLDFDWRFRLGDAGDTPYTYGFNDNSWRLVNTPHDFVVEGSFNESADLNHGFLPAGVGWYRQRFTLSADQLASNVRWAITFDGIYRAADVWLNGHYLTAHPSGYTSFTVPLPAQFLSAAWQRNELVVRCDATVFEGYWYEGGGIYRHVWIEGTDAVHVPPNGVFVRSFVAAGAISADTRSATSATITVVTSVLNEGSSRAQVSVLSAVQEFDSAKVVASVRSAVFSVSAGAVVNVTQNLTISTTVRLWSPEQPFRYALRSAVLTGTGSAETDATWTNFGVRTIEWSPSAGFKLNGKAYKIKGFCNHQDFAGVGVALPDSVQLWRLKTLKDVGANAVRSAHNPPSPEFLDYCDQLGVLVWDENRALRNDSNTRAELAAMVTRDRNHPSVVIWSLCNEFSCIDWAWGLAVELKSLVYALDGTRPVGAAFSGRDGLYDGFPRSLDVVGFNYHPDAWDLFHKKFPTQVVVGSETSSAESTRGVVVDDLPLAHLSSYDTHIPSWANHAWDAMQYDMARAYVAGSFVWTGFDYRGEPYPFKWPAVTSSYGVFDLAGFPKDLAFFYRAWFAGARFVHVFPHWNLAGVITGSSVEVWAYTTAPSVELLINGVSQGSRAVARGGFASWNVTFTPGTLTAVARDASGAVWASEQVQTTGAAAGLALSLAPLSAAKLWADGQDTAVVTASVVDQQGRLVPTASNLLQFSVSGSGSLLGVGNGDSSSHESDKASQRHAFNGLVRVLVQAGRSSSSGPIVLTASSAGLQSASLTISFN